MAIIEKEEMTGGVNEKVYVAVSKEIKVCKSVLLWALQNIRGKKVCLIHVHQPAQKLSVLGAKIPISSLSEQVVMAHWENDREHMLKTLNQYQAFCAKAGVHAEKLYVEMDIVENGIMELISHLKIERLVMGAAAHTRHIRNEMDLKSKKANYVRRNAPEFCHIWFVCKGKLICTREGATQSCLLGKNDEPQANVKPRVTHSTNGWSTPISRTNSFEDLDQSSFFSLSPLSGVSRFAERGSSSRDDKNQYHSQSIKDDHMDDDLYDRFDQAIAEAKAAKREAFQEIQKCHKAEKEASDAVQKAKTIERLYLDELKREKELQEDLGKAQKLLEIIMKQRDQALEELQLATNQKEMLETQVLKSDVVEKELTDKITSTTDGFAKLQEALGSVLANYT